MTQPIQQPAAPAAPADPAAPAVPAVPAPQFLPPAPAPAVPAQYTVTAPGVPQFTQPPAAPPAPAAAPAPQSPPGTGGTGQPQIQSVTDEEGNVYYYPADTPVAHMTPQQAAEYWRRQARKHEAAVKARGDYDELKAKAAEHDKLVAANQTEHERAVAEARRQGQAEALQQASTQLVDQWVRAVAHQRGIPQESVNALMPMIKPEAFLNAQGGVDTDKVNAFVNAAAPPAPAPAVPAVNPGQQPPVPAQAPAAAPAVVPVWSAPTGSPDFGQGQPGQAKATGLDAGREIARQKFGIKA